MRYRGLCLLVVGALGCSAGQGGAPASPSPAGVDASVEEALVPQVESGVRLRVEGAPSEPVVTVEASDDRAPLFGPAPLRDERLELPDGFWTLTIAVGEEKRRLQVYGGAGAEIVIDWGTSSEPALKQARGLDRDEAERWWKADLDRLMGAGAGAWDGQGEMPAELRAAFDVARAEIEAEGEGPYADLLRLRHASFVAQIAGPQAAWKLIESVPSDSIAWAAYAGHLLELGYFLRELPEAAAHLTEVGEQVSDPGVRSAFHALELLQAESSGDETAIARAVLDATQVAGPLRVGEPMPAFVMHSLDRGEVRSSDLEGPYMLELWSTWCEPCIEQMEALHAFHEASSKEEGGVQLVSININDTRDPVQAFRKERWPMPWTNAWVPTGEPLFAGWEVGDVRVPFAVLVNADGVVVDAGPKVTLEQARALGR